MFKVNYKDTRTTEFRTYFTPFSNVFIIHIEQVIFTGYFDKCEIPRNIEIKRNTGKLTIKTLE